VRKLVFARQKAVVNNMQKRSFTATAAACQNVDLAALKINVAYFSILGP